MEAVRENNQAENDEGESPWGMHYAAWTCNVVRQQR